LNKKIIIENLNNLFETKRFDLYQSGLNARFSANGMDYNYKYYNKNSIKSLIVILGNAETKTQIYFDEKGKLNLNYNIETQCYSESFKNCNEEGFHLMIAHAFIFVRDKNFEHHKE
jgi:hypothetical protein